MENNVYLKQMILKQSVQMIVEGALMRTIRTCGLVLLLVFMHNCIHETSLPVFQDGVNCTHLRSLL